MPLVIEGVSYFTAADVARDAHVTRQTIWRWRQEGKVPAGRRFRDKQVIFTADEAEKIRDYRWHRRTLMEHEKKIAVVLLSGGLDSTTTLAIAKSAGFDVHAMTFRYGQRHEAEIEASRRVASLLGVVEHVVVEIDLRLFGGSALTADIAVPKGRALADMGQGIPITYVPARNTIFLSFALAWAEVLKSQDIFIGVNALDYSGYPDCRPEYIAAYQSMANLATREGVEGRQKLQIHTPLISLTKAQIIRRGMDLGLDYGITSTCYDPGPKSEACGKCDACLLRLKGFAENGVSDPAPYLAGAIA